MCVTPEHKTGLNGALFQYDLPANKWQAFEADGFSSPVTGVIYRSATPIRGMPLGGLGTGYMHLGPDGLLDRATCFNAYLAPGAAVGALVHRKDIPAYDQPLLGLTIGERVWILALPKEHLKEGFEALTDQAAVEGAATGRGSVRFADELHYWGHYPVVDMAYETTAPVRVEARAWVPFILGDSEASNTPGMVIEVRVRNSSDTVQSGSVLANFPGFSELDALHAFRGSQMGLRGSTTYSHEVLNGECHGVMVHHVMEEYQNEVGYVLGVIGEEPARIGRDLGFDFSAWSESGSRLPDLEPHEPGTSLAVDFNLNPGQDRRVRFVLNWFAPFWQARHSYVSPYCPGTNPYTHKYYDRFKSPADVAHYLAREHATLEKRILGWQEAIYTNTDLPGWLSDSLINIFHILTQNSFWAVSRVPGHWAGPAGMFAINETLPTCAQFCTPCDWIGNFPVLFFFPDLVHQSLKALTHRQNEEGEIPFAMGAGIEMDEPYYGVQYSTDNQVYVHLVDRLWQRTGDRTILEEFYPAVKKAMGFLMSRDVDGDGLVDVWGGSWFYEGFPTKGASGYVGGLWLSTLRLACRMAGEMNDDEFAAVCASWLERGSRTMETVLWNEEAGSYRLYHQVSSGERSDVIQSDQLAGEWAARFHAVQSVLPADRVGRVIDTVWRINVAGNDNGVRATMHCNRAPYQGGYVTAYGTLIPAMVRLYHSQESNEEGLAPAHRMWYHMTCRQGWTWDQPSHFQADGQRMVGHDYYHNTMLWSLPPALLKQDVATFCGPDGFVDRILRPPNGK